MGGTLAVWAYSSTTMGITFKVFMVSPAEITLYSI